MKASRRVPIPLISVRRSPQRLSLRPLPNPRAIIASKSASHFPAFLQSRPFATRVVKPSNFVMPEPTNGAVCKARVLVFGAGNFGSCLADHLGDSAHEVFMWSRSAKVVEHFNAHHRNPDFLKDHVFPESIKAVGPDFPSAELIRSMDVLLFAIPTQGVRYVGLITPHLQAY